MKEKVDPDLKLTPNGSHGLRARRARSVLSIVLLALLLGAGLFLLAASRTTSPPPGSTSVAASQSGGSSQSGEDLSRRTLDKLIADEKFEEAAKEAARIREAAKRKGDQTVWAWALIKEAQLRTALHGYETAVRFLKDEAWPDSPADRDMLDLYYAQSLVTYYQSYSWEINKRERVEAKGPVDLKSWTRDQIFAEAWSALMRVWKDRERLADLRAKDYPDFWSPGDYPAGVRDTLRDSVVYLITRLLVDTTFWTPRQTNETYLLDLGKLMAGTSDAKSASVVLDSPDAHPLEKASSLLAEHESWSRGANRPEAALEARLVLFEALHGAFSQEEDRALIRTRLAGFLPAYRQHPWWSVGQAILAEFTRDENAPDALVRARSIALKGAEAYPLSPGGKRCDSIVKKIEAPEFSVEAMRNDAPGRRSVRVTHRNLPRLFFRAYAVDLVAAINSSKDYNLLPAWKETQASLKNQRPAASWKLDIPPTPDYRNHKTYAELPAGLAPGFYIVAASAREDFARKQNRILALNVLVSDLVLLDRGGSGGGADVLVLSGESGRPLLGVSVDLYVYDWQKGHHVAETRQTDAECRVRFPSRSGGTNFFLLARKGNEIAINPEYLYLNAYQERAESTDTLIYTDRSIYRPGQKIFWKILVFRGRRDLGRLKPATNATASVRLMDINSQQVAEATCVTNAFGTASGEFAIPAAGRPLGAWHLQSSPAGYAQVRVEEYKRPTFEVTVKDPVKPLRLNKSAALTAEARYYFGLPVASGAAVWQVRREPVYPRWWWGEGEDARSQVVAGGRGQVKEDGTIEVAFTPGADERKAGAGISYRYTLSVDVTDEGGETRTATRSFRLGFVSVEATVSSESGFVRADATSAFTITRSDLNGTPKPGKGAWRVVRLVQPETALLPRTSLYRSQRQAPKLEGSRPPGTGCVRGGRLRSRRNPSSVSGKTGQKRRPARSSTTPKARPRRPSPRSRPAPIVSSTRQKTTSAPCAGKA